MKHIKAKIEILSPKEEELVHSASLAVLGEIGIHMPEEKVLKIFADAGARVDFQNQVVYISENLIESILTNIWEASRKNNVNSHPNYLAITVTPQPFILDYGSKERRYGTMQDLLMGIIVSNQMRHLKSANPIVTPNDVPAPLSDLYSYRALYAYAKKPGDAYVNSEWSARYLFELAAVVGRQVSYLIEPVSPLRFTREHLRLALLFAEQGHRLSILPMVIAALSGPVSLAGTLVIQNAEVLASLVLVNLLGASCNYRYTGGAHTMDMRTSLCSFGSPNQVMLALAELQMARRYKLPCLSHIALSDALLPDFQSGFEKGFGAGIAAIAGIVRFGNQGHLGADQAASLEQMLIDDEWADYLNYTVSGFEINEESIALQVIKEIGIGGCFISTDHSARQARANYWKSDLFNRLPWDSWASQGNRTTYDLAHEKVKQVLTIGNPPQLLVGEKVLRAMDEIVNHASRALESSKN
jgi:trimethylamine---corrinoid protein Co-methyltransferase